MNISKDFKNLDKFSFTYSFLKLYIDFFLRFLFRKFNIIGLDKLPKDKAFIIAPNHQVAIDPIIILKLFKRPVFISRADLFKKRLLAKFLIFSRLIPSFRVRDGKENLKYNKYVFKRVAEVLQNGSRIVIFPEARHFNKRHLLPLKKGMTRIAFTAEEEKDFELDLSIVPTGIYYSNYYNFKSDVRVVFGEPVSVKKYKELYLQDSAKANAKLRDEVAEAIKKNIVHIQDLDNYDAYETIRTVSQTAMLQKLSLKKNALNELKADKETIKTVENIHEENPGTVNLLFAKAREYQKRLDQYKFRNWLFEKEKFPILGLFGQFLLFSLSFPLFLYGFLNNILAIQPQRILNQKMKDPQFHSFIKYLTLLFIVPIIHWLQFIPVAVLTDIWWIKWVYLLSLLPTGLFAYYYHRYWVKFSAKVRFLRFRGKNKDLYKKLQGFRKEIISAITKGSFVQNC